MKTRFSYNPKYEYTWDTAEWVVKDLQNQGYKARCIMGISLMQIHTDASKTILDNAIKRAWDKEVE
tara:strand:+ start:701 stop:898 length:198 start_codon:yes stop_codon:yes gene_type:complete